MRSVCIVEDDAAVRESLAVLLECSGYQAFAFPSAEEFLEDEVARSTSEFLIVDVRLPGMTGIELLELINANENPIPAVVITGHAKSDEFGNSPILDRVEFLSKPCDPVKLLTLIENALG